LANKLTKKYLDIPGHRPHNEGMANASNTKSVTTPTPEDSDELSEWITGRIADMETAADAGDPIAIAALASGYAERMRLTDF
jgi:mono/diheme cytochrome c family protein